MAAISKDQQRALAQCRVLEDRILNGALDPLLIRKPLQDIIRGLVPAEVALRPSWHSSPEAQVRMVSDFLSRHGDNEVGYRPDDIPAIPTNVSLRSGEVLLLVAYLPDKGRIKGLHRTLDAWCESAGQRLVFRSDFVKGNAKSVRIAHGVEYRAGVYWVVLDVKAGKGKSPEYCLKNQSGGTQPALLAPLMLAVLSPDWVKAWGSDWPYPNLTGIEVYCDGRWSHVPDLCRSGDGQFEVGTFRADSEGPDWGSPDSREC